MATGDGNSFSKTVVKESHQHVPDTEQPIYREVYYARYLDWTLTTPLLLLDLALLAGLSGANILVAIVVDIVMILTGLFAAYGREGAQKWGMLSSRRSKGKDAWLTLGSGYYTISCLAYLAIVYLLAVSGRRDVQARDSKTATFFSSIALYTVVIWTAYPM